MPQNPGYWLHGQRQKQLKRTAKFVATGKNGKKGSSTPVSPNPRNFLALYAVFGQTAYNLPGRIDRNAPAARL